MADKRPANAFHYVQPRRKIPKLDISITASGSCSSSPRPARHDQFVRPAGRPVTTASSSNHVPTSVAAESEDMWGDDDVELIMLASQVAENVENVRQNILVGSMDITFGTFLNGNAAAGSTSTQMPAPAVADDAVLRDFRATGGADDDVFTELMDFDQFDNIDQNINKYLANERNSLVPGFGGTGRTPGPSSHSAAPPPTSLRADQQHAGEKKQLEVQTKLLCEQRARVQSENDRLQQEVRKLNEKCQTRDGEIAVLRYDLQKNRNIQQDLRKEKLDECERIKNEYLGQLNELDRRNQKQQSELEFKLLEIINLKSKRMHESAANRSTTVPPPSGSGEWTLSEAAKEKMFRLHLPDAPVHRPLPSANMFCQSRCQDQSARLVFAQLDSLRTHVTQLQLLVAEQNVCVATGRPMSDGLVDRVFAVAAQSVWTIRNECRAYESTHHNRSTKNMFYHYDTDELNACRARLLRAGSVYVDGEMCDGEMLSNGRRALGCLAAICRSSAKCCEAMAVRRFREERVTCLEVLAEAFMAVGYSNQWHYLFGLMEAGAMLLSAIAANYADKGQLFDQPLQDLLRALIFSRPNTRALTHLSSCLRSLAQHCATSQFLETICQHSSDFVAIKESTKRVQYSAKSCALQMYAVLLQTEFAQFRPLTAAHLAVLTTVTQDTLVLLDRCFRRPVTWIFRRNSTRELAAKKDPCVCYAELVCASIVLVYLSLRHWVHDPKCIDLRIISNIAQLGVIMISDHFVIHCQSIVLRVGGSWVKQRLHVAFSWIERYSSIFRFERAHLYAIQSISHLRRIPQMIELLNSGDTDEPAVLNATFESSWDQLFEGVATMAVGGDADNGEESDARSRFSADSSTLMQVD